MERLLVKMALPGDQQQVSNWLLKSEGFCTCGRVMKRMDPKFILANVVPTMASIIIAAYCMPCATDINRTLKSIRKVIYDKSTESGKVKHEPKEI